MQRFWWLNLIRGIIALVIGILIVGWPQTAQHFFVNFLALYWLSSGLISVREGFSTHLKKGWWLVDGLLGIIIGLGLLLRPAYDHYIAPALVIRGFGLIALFMGFVHIFSIYQTAGRVREQALGHLLLGVFEAGLGALLIFSDQLGPWARLLAACWSLTGGALLILQSVQRRRATSIRS